MRKWGDNRRMEACNEVDFEKHLERVWRKMGVPVVDNVGIADRLHSNLNNSVHEISNLSIENVRVGCV